jgi:tryptophan halogenase
MVPTGEEHGGFLDFPAKVGVLARDTDAADVLAPLVTAGRGARPFDASWAPPLPDREYRYAQPGRLGAPDDDAAIRSVGIIGGGTAGYLTALALRARLPHLSVTIVESSRIPIIGVGEATTPSIVPFLHDYLDIDPQDFVAKVRPTWKLGIKFEWGPYPDGFMAPFDWAMNTVGVLGSLRERGHPNDFTLQSMFMQADRVPVFRLDDGSHVSFMDDLPFAYHLDNKSFVRYLKELASARGIGYLDATVEEVVLSGDDWVDHLVVTGNPELRYDLYVDCTGFRSLLLGKALKTDYVDYSASLLTNTAVTATVPAPDPLQAYTTATTMEAGWCWNIPMPAEGHIGYVHASEWISEDGAAKEITARYPEAKGFHTVRFRSGRYRDSWRGNVVAIGNSAGFVEPLESTALLMMTNTITSLVSLLPHTWRQAGGRDVFNRATADRWDGLRWFLAVHYRFNTRSDAPFWQAVRADVDVSGMQPILDMFERNAPLRFLDPTARYLLAVGCPLFYEMAGVDCVLLGQRHPTTRFTTTEPAQRWRDRRRAVAELTRHALDHRSALRAYDDDPELLAALVGAPSSWTAVGR